MKKKLLIYGIALLGFAGYSQTQPTVYNATFDKIAKNSGSDCACSGWINKSVADQAESSTKDSNDVIKFDNQESDGIYQEVAVEANSNYTLDLDYWYSDGSTTTTQYIEIIILKGSSYVDGYTPAYAVPSEAEQDGFGYDSLTEVDDVNNHVARATIVPPGNSDKNSISQLTFNTGAETSIAIFIRAIGPYDSSSHGDSGKDKGWMNGDTEVRIDNLVLANLGGTASVDDVFSSKVAVYPNPAKESVTVTSQLELNKVEVFNLLGKQVIKTTNLNNNILDVSSLSKGVYLIKLTSGDSVATRKFIKN